MASHGTFSKTTKASTSTRVPLEDAFFVPNTRTSTACATAGSRPFLEKADLRACNPELYRSTVLARVPSTSASALPRSAPLGEIHATLRAPPLMGQPRRVARRARVPQATPGGACDVLRAPGAVVRDGAVRLLEEVDLEGGALLQLLRLLALSLARTRKL